MLRKLNLVHENADILNYYLFTLFNNFQFYQSVHDKNIKGFRDMYGAWTYWSTQDHAHAAYTWPVQ